MQPTIMRGCWKHWVNRKFTWSQSIISQIAHKLQRGKRTFTVKRSDGHNLPKSSNLALPRVRQLDNMGLWCDTIGSTHYLHAILDKVFHEETDKSRKWNILQDNGSNLEGIMLSEINLTEKDKHCMLSMFILLCIKQRSYKDILYTTGNKDNIL